MTARSWQAVTDEHRAEASRDDRSGVIYVRLRKHKRGHPVSFTLAQWLEFVRAVKAGELDGLASAVMTAGIEMHELVFTDREARPAKWETRCGRTGVPLEQAISPDPNGYYKVTCPACLAGADSAVAHQGEK